MGGLIGRLAAGAARAELKMTSRELGELIRGGHMSNSGARVNWKTALQVSTVLACSKVIVEGIAQVPWKLHQGVGGGSAATDHPLYDLLYRRPNSWQTSFEFRETLGLHCVLDRQRVRLEGDGRQQARTADPRADRAGPDAGHPRKRRTFPLLSAKPAKAIKKSSATPTTSGTSAGPAGTAGWASKRSHWLVRRSGSRWRSKASRPRHTASGARISGMYSVKDKLGVEKYEQVSAWLKRFRQGGDKAGEDIILDQEAKFQPFQMTGVEAQTLESRRHQVEEICRSFRVMPIMVGQSDKTATYASAEQMFLAHVVHCLLPWYERWCMSADVNLLSEEDRRAGFYTKLNPNALMRGAAKDRADYYTKALGAGGGKPWMKQNEVRALEEMDESERAMGERARPGRDGPQTRASTPTTGLTIDANQEQRGHESRRIRPDRDQIRGRRRRRGALVHRLRSRIRQRRQLW
jgi:phage portal protein BeeE